MITSAIGGEGKTTLAAQLAARCGNAGVKTLLIDSDFRRSSLCTLLDIPRRSRIERLAQGRDKSRRSHHACAKGSLLPPGRRYST